MTTQRVKYSVPLLHEMWARGDSYTDIAAALGCSVSFLTKLKDRHKLPNRPRSYTAPSGDPTPEEIAERAAAIRRRNIEAMRSESEETTRSRLWKEQHAEMRRMPCAG